MKSINIWIAIFVLLSSTCCAAQISTTNKPLALDPIFDNYFALKDALVESNANLVSEKSKLLQTTMLAVKMNKLNAEEHTAWMKIQKDLLFDAKHIEDTKNIQHQRAHFITLSKNIYALIKVSKLARPTYYQFCPMANDGKGAYWLSKESGIKNPYYGTQMLGCGKVVETIKAVKN